MNKSLILFIIFFVFFTFPACSSVETKEENDSKPLQTVTESEPKPVELKKKKSVAEDIIVRDIYSKEEYPLSRIATHGIVFIELSASWCKACPEMKATTTKLLGYFEGKVSFVRLYQPDDIQEDKEYRDIIPEMAIVSSPAELSLEKTEAMPRVVVLSNSASEVTADITGVYPILYYYGLLSDL